MAIKPNHIVYPRNYMKLLVLIYFAIIVTATPSHADIYRYEDEEGFLHFAESPTDPRFKLFMADTTKEEPKVKNVKVGKLIFKKSVHGSIFAVNATTKKNIFYWVLGDHERFSVNVVDSRSIKVGRRLLIQGADEVRESNDSSFVWLKGLPEYDCFVATLNFFNRSIPKRK